MNRLLALLPPTLVFAFAAPAAAQDPPDSAAAGRVVEARGAACDSGAVSYVFIDNHSIFDTSDPDLDRRFAWLYRVANSLHVQTRRGVIRRELLFSTGDCYDAALLAESERLLRSTEFLSRVDIFGIRQPDSSYHVVVDTQDEWSTQIDLRLRLAGGLTVERVALREMNLLGTGQMVGLFFVERDVTRDYGVAYQTPQLARTRWNLHAAAGRTRAGTLLRQAVFHPFVGEFGRWAAVQGFRHEDRYFGYVAGDARDRPLHLLVPLREKSVDVAALHRFGRPGDLVVLGGGIAYQGLTYPRGAVPRLVEGRDFGNGTPADDSLVAPLARQLGELDALRAVVVLGKRNVDWVRRRGLDSMRGVQDVRLGSDVEVSLGRSLPFGGESNDAIVSLDAYAAREAGGLLVAGRLAADARRDEARRRPGAGESRDRWGDRTGEAELLAYWRRTPQSRHTFLARVAGAGGWATRTPFQLTLGGDRAVRGYAPERYPGGRRAVLSLEDRVYFGWPLVDVFDLGGTLFVDVGRVWPGDAPYGADSGWRAAAGAGLRGTLPAGGRTTYRLDLALPLDRAASLRDLRLILSVGELLGLSASEQDMHTLRARRGAASRFLHVRS